MRARAILVCTFLLISAVGVGATTYKTLHSFGGFSDGESPYPGVIFDPAGNLYGVAAWGEESEGTIFSSLPHQATGRSTLCTSLTSKIPKGQDRSVVWPWMRPATSTEPPAPTPAILDAARSSKISPSGSYWTLTVLHYFAGADGCDPEAALSYSNGWLWGTAKSGGFKDRGTVFSMQTSGESFQFDSFSGKCKGHDPSSAFNLWGYGTTLHGGWKDLGNIYRLDPAKRLINKYSFTADGKAGYAPMGDLLALYVGEVRTITRYHPGRRRGRRGYCLSAHRNPTEL